MPNRRKNTTWNAGNVSVALLGLLLSGSAAYAVPPTKAPSAPAPGLTDLGILENRFFSHPYSHDPVDKRLERLECMVFGGIQAGTPEERLSHLIKVVAQRSQTPLKEEKAPVANNQNSDSPDKAAPPAASAGKGSNQYPVLNTLEWRALKKTYPAETLDQRLDRLESKTFGQPAQGMAYADRVERLRKVLGIGIDTGVGSNPLTAGGIGPAPRARANSDEAPSFGPTGNFPFPMGNDFGFSFGMPGNDLFDATFDKQLHSMMEQMNRHMAEARRLGPGSWRFDPKTNSWVDLDSGKRTKPPMAGDIPKTAPGPRFNAQPPIVAPQRKPQTMLDEVPPYADPNSI